MILARKVCDWQCSCVLGCVWGSRLIQQNKRGKKRGLRGLRGLRGPRGRETGRRRWCGRRPGCNALRRDLLRAVPLSACLTRTAYRCLVVMSIGGDGICCVRIPSRSPWDTRYIYALPLSLIHFHVNTQNKQKPAGCRGRSLQSLPRSAFSARLTKLTLLGFRLSEDLRSLSLFSPRPALRLVVGTSLIRARATRYTTLTTANSHIQLVENWFVQIRSITDISARAHAACPAMLSSNK